MGKRMGMVARLLTLGALVVVATVLINMTWPQ
jgi:hypothetical protein